MKKLLSALTLLMCSMSLHAAIVGSQPVIAWSFTIPNPGPTPQIINLGPPPTDANYVPILAILRGLQLPQANGLVITMGTNSQNPNNVINSIQYSSSENDNLNGYRTYGVGGMSIVPAAQNLYVEYSEPQNYTGTPITVDVLAYPVN